MVPERTGAVSLQNTLNVVGPQVIGDTLGVTGDARLAKSDRRSECYDGGNVDVAGTVTAQQLTL